jgi:arginine/lysine/ornithine decarboxylase
MSSCVKRISGGIAKVLVTYPGITKDGETTKEGVSAWSAIAGARVTAMIQDRTEKEFFMGLLYLGAL